MLAYPLYWMRPEEPRPFLVVIMMTPFAPLLPYMAVDEASFRTSMEAMSSVFIKARELICESMPAIPMPEDVATSPRGKPSTTIRGDVEPERDAAPRISILDAAPG